MGLFDIFKRKKVQKEEMKYPEYLYSESELDEYEAYIKKAFGKYEEVLHEIVSPDIHLDVIIIPPSEQEDYYKLITMGAGAYAMNVPSELEQYELEHAEYVIYLPKEWNIKSNAQKDYWPIGMLKQIARIPIYCDTWLGFGHTVHGDEKKSPFSENTMLNSFLLLNAVGMDGEICEIKLKSGKHIRFYQLMVLYQEELEYKIKTNVEELLNRFPDEEFPPVVYPNRKNYCI